MDSKRISLQSAPSAGDSLVPGSHLRYTARRQPPPAPAAYPHPARTLGCSRSLARSVVSLLRTVEPRNTSPPRCSPWDRNGSSAGRAAPAVVRDADDRLPSTAPADTNSWAASLLAPPPPAVSPET